MGKLLVDMDIAPTVSENRIKNMYGQIQEIMDEYKFKTINEGLFRELCFKLQMKQANFDHVGLPPSLIFVQLYGDGLSKENGQFSQKLWQKMIKSPKYEKYADEEGLKWYNELVELIIKETKEDFK